MNNDKELLELAAKAAGIEIAHIELLGDDGWNPLTDDGDALRLAVKLEIDLVQISGGVCVVCGQDGTMDVYEYFNTHNNDPYAATRRAIVRAAAEIGRGME